MIQKIKEYFDHLGYNQATKEAKNTFLGVILVKFGTGAIGIWGIINIYFFSFYRKNDDELKMSEFVFLITFAAIPMSIIAIFSVRIAQMYGFEKIIRGAMIINPISIMLGSMQDNFYTFALFNTFIASICFGSTVMPILYCLWSHFPKKTGNATGIALASFGLATFFYSIVATHIVNPENLPASIEYVEGSQTYYLFEEEVSDNVPQMTFWLGFIQMFFCIPGALLITNNKESETLLNEYNEEEDEKELEMNLLGSNYEKNVVVQQDELKYEKYQEKDYHILKQESSNSHQLYPDNLQSQNQVQRKSERERTSSLTPSNKQQKRKSLSQQYLLEWHAQVLGQQVSGSSEQKSYNNIPIPSSQNIPLVPQSSASDGPNTLLSLNNNLAQQKSQQQQNQQQSKQQEITQPQIQLTLMEAVKSKPFIIIYISTFLLSCFSLFVSINFKTYGLTKINDDHFLTYLITVCTLISSISNIGWGYLVDKYNFRTVYLNLILVILTAGFLFPHFSDTKIGFFIFYQILSASERGLYTIIGPGLVKIFGMKLGAELFPIKSTSFFLALVILPVIQLFLLQFFDYDETIHLLLLGIIAAFFMSKQLQISYDFRK